MKQTTLGHLRDLMELRAHLPDAFPARIVIRHRDDTATIGQLAMVFDAGSAVVWEVEDTGEVVC